MCSSQFFISHLKCFLWKCEVKRMSLQSHEVMTKTLAPNLRCVHVCRVLLEQQKRLRSRSSRLILNTTECFGHQSSSCSQELRSKSHYGWALPFWRIYDSHAELFSSFLFFFLRFLRSTYRPVLCNEVISGRRHEHCREQRWILYSNASSHFLNRG